MRPVLADLLTCCCLPRSASDWLLPVCLLVLLCCGPRVSAQAPDKAPLTATLHAGGTGRFVPARWGVVKGIAVNHTDQPAPVQMVVIPPASDGLQYARTVTVPAHSSLETTWPVRVPPAVGGNIDFQYLVFPGGEDAGVIHRRPDEQMLAVFSALMPLSGKGYTGWLATPSATSEENQPVQDLMRTLRYTAQHDQAVVMLQPRELDSQPEALDCLDQLAVSCSTLDQYPDVCEAIRLWNQRGGRLMLFLDRTGPAVAELLLGDALPMTVVGDTSDNTVLLEINPEYRTDSYPVRELRREFEEPVRWLRVAADAGEPIWFVDGWPVALRVTCGAGAAVVTTIAPEVFIVPREHKTDEQPRHELVGSMRRMLETAYASRPPQLLQAEQITRQAAEQIGYQIPSRGWAAGITLLFPVAGLAAGLWLLRRQRGEALIWLVPVLAILAAIPAVGKGLAVRGVAPTTVIQTQLVQAIPGHAQLVSDGVATVYSPDPQILPLRGEHGAIIEPPADTASRDLRRLLWTSRSTSSWSNLQQPAGINSYPLRHVRRFSAPLDARATFDVNGLTGRLTTADLTQPRDAVAASQTPDRMAVNIQADGRFQVRAADVLSPEQFFQDALLTDEKRQHAEVFAGLFRTGVRSEKFPETPSVLYWADAADSGVRIGDDAARQQQSLLVVQPIRLEAPPLNQTITIPPAWLPFRTVADAQGSFSAVFNNAQRQWDPNGREAAGNIRLQFDVPSVCLPFAAQSADVNLRIRAGSRTVTVRMGTPDNLQVVQQLNSPVGAFRFEVPADVLRNSIRDGQTWLELQVSELAASTEGEPASGEQDDAWVIERLLLTLQGQRVAAGP